MRDTEVRALLDPDALELLASLPPFAAQADVLRSVADLRKRGHSTERVAAVLAQHRLRAKASAKFGDFAERMLFTDAGLQQASRLRVAAVHANRYRLAGVERVIDLGCGIAGDSLALAAAGLQVRAIERDEATAALASYNLAPFENAQVEHADAEQLQLAPGEAVWADPARRRTDERGQTQRLSRASDFEPSLDWLLGLAAERPVGIKLGPATDRAVIPAHVPVEAQWLSDGGSVVELTLWLGGMERPGIGRSALILNGEGSFELSAETDLPELAAGPLGRYLFEPDGAVIRSRLMPLIAEPLDAHLVSPGIAYLSGDRAEPSPFYASFELTESWPFDEKLLRRELASRDIGILEIKKRGVDVDPAELRKRLKLSGTQQATLFITKVAGSKRALLANRLS